MYICFRLYKKAIKNSKLNSHKFSCDVSMIENLYTNWLNFGRHEFSQDLFITGRHTLRYSNTRHIAIDSFLHLYYAIIQVVFQSNIPLHLSAILPVHNLEIYLSISQHISQQKGLYWPLCLVILPNLHYPRISWITTLKSERLCKMYHIIFYVEKSYLKSPKATFSDRTGPFWCPFKYLFFSIFKLEFARNMQL